MLLAPSCRSACSRGKTSHRRQPNLGSSSSSNSSNCESNEGYNLVTTAKYHLYRKRCREKYEEPVESEEKREKCVLCRGLKENTAAMCEKCSMREVNEESSSNLMSNMCLVNLVVEEGIPIKRNSEICNLRRIIKNLRKSQVVLIMLLLLLSHLSTASVMLVNAQSGSSKDVGLSTPIVPTEPPKNERVKSNGVCGIMDIRNEPKQLANLRGCRVIEGFLQILLMDRYEKEAFQNYSFPELVEVTGYVLLYRVNGLNTLRNLFPNLAVIRGDTLFDDNALIIYEMLNMEEIGLKSLVSIMNGGVRIEKNTHLCFADTVDWTQIAHNTTVHDHFISGNKRPNECPVCKKQATNGEICNESKTHPGKEKYLCWNVDSCQKVCPPECPGNCRDSKTCCPSNCTGGCDGTEKQDCVACKDLVEYRDGKRHCVNECPKELYAFGSWRCLTKEECENRPRPITSPKTELDFPFIAFRNDRIPGSGGKCITDCPTGYGVVNANCTKGDDGKFPASCHKRCEKCIGACEKHCNGGPIESISSARSFKDCTVIEGPLEISIRNQGGLNIVKELEESLSTITRITKHLKVIRSYPLVSLNFLKRLTRIDGEGLDANKDNALIVMDNQNLQDLFEPNRKFSIGKGKLAFHYNPKLCLYKIEQFKSRLDRNIEYDSYDATKNSNGDKIACNVTKLEVSVTSIAHKWAILKWDKFPVEDDRSLLGYVVFYTEAPFQNVTLYDGRDACGGDGWEIEDAGPNEPIHPLLSLKPYTQYAFYVKTLLISSERYGGQSDIMYFRTLSGEPDQIVKMTLTSNASSEIVVNWSPPRRFNGEPDLYEVTVNLTEDKNILEKRDYCLQTLKEGEDLNERPLKPQEEPIAKETCEACSMQRCMTEFNLNKKGKIDEDFAIQSITFEDRLHDWVYIKQQRSDNNNRQKRENVELDLKLIPERTTTLMSLIQETTEGPTTPETVGELPIQEYEQYDDKGTYLTYKSFRTNETHVVIKDLKHFSSYTIAVRACRKPISKEIKSAPRCSITIIESTRTLKIDGADDIKEFSIFAAKSNNSVGAIRLVWSPPPEPNAIIVSYSIKYVRVDGFLKVKPQCITAKEFKERNNQYTIEVSEPGNYSFQVMATSIAGDGKYTEPLYMFIEEQTNRVLAIFLVIGIVLVFCIIAGVGAFYYFKQKFPAPTINMKLIANVNPEYVSMQYTPDDWEVPREKIIQMQELGQGSFGMVYAGILKDSNKMGEEIKCAVKTVNENATDRERINFLKEASVMKGFDTTHVVKLLGVVSSGQPTLVVMELMANGDLKGYLRAHRPDRDSLDGPAPQPPTLKQVYKMALEIADGMAYLAFKKFVHRDLAARNCMVAEDLTVKIGDFGMTRDIYETDYYRKGTKGLLPVRWMAPESLKDGVFTSASDVFSYGVVLWEMATLASQPYQGLSNDQVLRYVIDGGVMERPENCPDKLYDLMRRCWTHRPTARPSFMEIVGELINDGHPSFKQVSFYNTDEGQRYLDETRRIPQIDDVTTPLTRPDDDEEDNSTDGDTFLTNRTNSHHLVHRDETLPVIRSSQPLSGGLGSGLLSYPIDEETDDVNDEDRLEQRQTSEDFQRIQKNPFSSENGSAASGRLTSPSKEPPRQVAINVAQSDSPTGEHYVGLRPPPNKKRSLFQTLNQVNQNNSAFRHDVEDPEDNEEDEFSDETCGLTSTKKHPIVTASSSLSNEKRISTEEELRPLSNGFLLQKS